jgi:hypothetical protein
MSNPYPLIPLRKTPDGIWELERIVEIIDVPADPPYSLKLKEMPDNGELQSAPQIVGFTETRTYPPGNNEFYINYKNADIFFNTNQKELQLTITYYGKGSPLTPDKLNLLNDNISQHELNKQIHIRISDGFPFYPTSSFTYISSDILYSDVSSMSFTYNNLGFVDTIMFDTGRSIKYSYNNLGFVSTETLYDFDGSTVIHIYTYTYDSNNRLLSKSYSPNF